MRKEVSVSVDIPLLIWESKEDECWYAACPSLQFVTFGKDEKDAIAMGKDAIEGWIECMRENTKEEYMRKTLKQ